MSREFSGVINRTRTVHRFGAGVFALVFLMLCISCTNSDGNSNAAPEENSDLVKEEQAPENKKLPDDLAPLEIETAEKGVLGSAQEAVEQAENAAKQVLSVTGQIATRADGQSEGIGQIAHGFVQGELEALAAERWQMGVRQVGEAKLISVETDNVDLEAEIPSMDLRVCLDLSAIDVVDEQGNSFEGLLYKPEHPVLNVYGAVFIDGQWKISTHEIPEESACKDASSEQE